MRSCMVKITYAHILHKNFWIAKNSLYFFDAFYRWFSLKGKSRKRYGMKDVAKRYIVEMCAYNSCFPGSSWIAIVPESGTIPEIFRSIEPRALITRRFVRERLQGFSRQRWRREAEKGRRANVGVEISAVFRQGSFRLFWLQSPGCRYCHNFRRAASVQPISPHYPFAVISSLATARRNESEIGNFEASASVNSANSDGRPAKPVIPDIFRDL